MILIEQKGLSLVLSKFSDGTQKVEIQGEPMDETGRFGLDLKELEHLIITWRFENESEILTLLYVVNWFRDHHSQLKISLNLPYVPYARMDRVEEKSDVFTLKYFTNLINSMNFESVFVLDPHSRVSAALIDRVIVEEPIDYITSAIEKILRDNRGTKLTVLFPDRGSYERYLSPKLRERFEALGVNQFLYGEKVRDWKTSNIQNFSINTRGLCEIGDVLIIDDIITTGGTIEECVKALDHINATGKVYIYATFLEKGAFSNPKFQWVLDQCENVITTSALPLGEYENHPKLISETVY